MRRLSVVVLLVLVALVVLVGGGIGAEQVLAQNGTAVAEGDEREESTFEFVAFAPLATTPDEPVVIGLLWYELEPGAEDPAAASPEDQLVVVEAGAITLAVEEGMATVQRADQAAALEPGDEALAAGDEATLEEGDSIFVPGETSVSATNDGDEAAAALIVFVGAPAEEDASPEAAATPDSDATPVALDEEVEGVTVQLLAVGLGQDVPSAPFVGLVRVTYPAGASDSPTDTTSPFVAYVEEGTIAYELDEGDSLVSRAEDGVPNLDPAAAERVAAPDEFELAEGSFFIEQAGTVSGYGSAADEPVSLLLAALFPVDEGAAEDEGAEEEEDATPES